MEDNRTYAIRLEDNGNLPVVFVNYGHQELVTMTDREFVEYACKSHLEEYLYTEVDGRTARVFCDLYPFYTEDERQRFILNMERLTKFSLMETPPAAFKEQCIGAFNAIWDVMQREGQ